MSVTPEFVEAEHKAAIDSLTRDQQRALARVRRAAQMSHFNHRRVVENLAQIFQEEADRRNLGDAGTPAHDVPEASAFS